MNGMTPFKAYWNTKLIGLKGGRSTVTEMVETVREVIEQAFNMQFDGYSLFEKERANLMMT